MQIGHHQSLEWYDAWTLAAILAAVPNGDDVSLTRLIAVADGLNHAIINRSELELAMGRLIEAGYVRITASGFAATSKAAGLNVQGVGSYIQRVSEAIGARHWAPATQIPKTTAASYVTVEAYEQAVRHYVKKHGV